MDRNGSRLGEVPGTPGSIRLDKSKNDMVVTCSKRGYQTATVSQSPKFDGTTFGNIILGGIIGAVADAASGADFEYPGQVTLQLAPVGATPGAYSDPPPAKTTDSVPSPLSALPAGASGDESAAATLFDGEYWGEPSLVKVIGECTRPNPSAIRAVSITNGEVRFIYNFGPE